MTSSSRKRRRVSSQKKAAVETNMEQLESQVEAQPNMDLAEEFGEDNNLDMESSKTDKPPCPVAQRGKMTPSGAGMVVPSIYLD